ncbi:hypothetical protein KMP13_04455 [Epibacterium ulvae]|uniref:acyl-homoserine-lactone synthase n=1 Tax=Epibacterium ulvae TaxID=1156985 RepID=UPI001BFCCD2D|nr:acyl-homoserine-lactone synthase [Epibacterium ulvae]MBT8153152.1 hypothetical protein [Epibacterium ulvae]
MLNAIAINQSNRGAYGHLLDKMFRARYDLFHGSLGWDVPRAAPIEMDQYDRADTVYIIVEDGGELMAYARLVSCASRVLYGDQEWTYMVQDAARGNLPSIPSNIIDGLQLPQGGECWEMTRTEARSASSLKVLFSKANRFLLDHGATETIAFSRTNFVGILNRLGYPTRRGSASVAYGSKNSCAMSTMLQEAKTVSSSGVAAE